MTDAHPPHRPPSDSPPVDTLDERLRREALLPVPADLAARVMLGLPSRRRGLDRRTLLRFAAAVLAAFGAWIFATGAVPSVANAAPAPLLEQALAGTRAALPEAIGRGLAPWAASATGSPGAPPALIALLGVVSILLGLWLARRLLAGRPDPERRNTS